MGSCLCDSETGEVARVEVYSYEADECCSECVTRGIGECIKFVVSRSW